MSYEERTFDPRMKTQIQEELQPQDFIRALWRQKWWLLLATLAVMAATAGVSLSMPPIYRATALLVPPETDVAWPTPDGMKTRFGAAGVGGAIKPGTTATDVIIGMLKSRRLAHAVMDKFDLQNVYAAEPPDLPLPRLPGKKSGQQILRSDVLDKLRSRTDIGVTKEGLLSIRVEDRDPQRAAAMVQCYLDELNRANMELLTTYNQYLARVLDAPVVPDKKHRPRVKFNTALSGAAAVFAWIAGSVLWLSVAGSPAPARAAAGSGRPEALPAAEAPRGGETG